MTDKVIMKMEFSIKERIEILEGLILAKVKVESALEKRPDSAYNRKWLKQVKKAMEVWERAEKRGEFV